MQHAHICNLLARLHLRGSHGQPWAADAMQGLRHAPQGMGQPAAQQLLQRPKSLVWGQGCSRLCKQQTAAESLEPRVMPGLLQAAQA